MRKMPRFRWGRGVLSTKNQVIDHQSGRSGAPSRVDQVGVLGACFQGVRSMFEAPASSERAWGSRLAADRHSQSSRMLLGAFPSRTLGPKGAFENRVEVRLAAEEKEKWKLPATTARWKAGKERAVN